MKTALQQKPAQKMLVSPKKINNKGNGIADKMSNHPLLNLQRTLGNQAILGMIKSGALQTKLTVNQPGDVYEQEADRVADQVMRMSDNETLQTNPSPINIQRKCAECEKEEKLQRQKKDNEDNFPRLTLTTSFLPSSREPDYLALRQPFFNRNVPHLWDREAALGIWNYNFNFFHRIGLSPDLSATLSDITAPHFIDSQLKADNPSWWEITDQQLKTTTISGSIPVLEFGPNFSIKAPSWVKKIFKKIYLSNASAQDVKKKKSFK